MPAQRRYCDVCRGARDADDPPFLTCAVCLSAVAHPDCASAGISVKLTARTRRTGASTKPNASSSADPPRRSSARNQAPDEDDGDAATTTQEIEWTCESCIANEKEDEKLTKAQREQANKEDRKLKRKRSDTAARTAAMHRAIKVRREAFLQQNNALLAPFGVKLKGKNKGKQQAQPPPSKQPKRAAKEKANASTSSLEDLDSDTTYVDPSSFGPETPEYVQATLRDYQVTGVRWMLDRFRLGVGGILSDEMGLGKTIQSLSFLAALKHQGVNGPSLIIVPTAVAQNWTNELRRFTPSLSFIKVAGASAERTRVLETPEATYGDFDVCITTYETFLAEEHYFVEMVSWLTIVIDEGHRLKNDTSKLQVMLKRVTCPFRLLLTGTPLQNNMRELWSLLSYILPEIATNAASEAFARGFSLDKGNGKVPNQQGMGDAQIITAARNLLEAMSMRRVKADVEKTLMPKKVSTIFVPMAPPQLTWYRRIFSPSQEEKLELLESSQLTALFLQLMKVVNHPKQLLGAIDARRRQNEGIARRAAGGDFAGKVVEESAAAPVPGETAEQERELRSMKGQALIDASNKLRLLDRLLFRLRSRGSRVLIFSQWTACLDVLQEYVEFRFGALGEAFFRLDGNTNRVTRETDVRAFNAPGSRAFCYLISTRAGGVGLNLATADTVVLFDSSYNPQVDLQAMDRAHRIGQTKQVRVYRLVTALTLEERVVARATQKMLLDKAVVQSAVSAEETAAAAAAAASTAAGERGVMDDTADIGGASLRELRAMLRCGTSEIFDATSDVHRALGVAEVDNLLSRADQDGGTIRMEGALPIEYDEELEELADEIPEEKLKAMADDGSLLWWHVKVHWPAESRWFTGQLMYFNADLRERYVVVYEDGEMEWIDLPDDSIIVLRSGDEPVHFKSRWAAKIKHMRRQLGDDGLADPAKAGRRSSRIQTLGPTSPPPAAAEVGAGAGADNTTPSTQPMEVAKGDDDSGNDNKSDKAAADGAAAAAVALSGIVNGRRERKQPKKFEPVSFSREVKTPKKKLVHDDECFNCGDGGDLICCDVCPRVYHLKCAGLRTVPKGVYRCPWHSCYSCGRTASEAGGRMLHCATCPTTYCLDCIPESLLANRRADLDAPRKAELLRLGMQDIPSTPAAFIACELCLESGENAKDVAKHEERARNRAAMEERIRVQEQRAAAAAKAMEERLKMEAERAKAEAERKAFNERLGITLSGPPPMPFAHMQPTMQMPMAHGQPQPPMPMAYVPPMTMGYGPPPQMMMMAHGAPPPPPQMMMMAAHGAPPPPPPPQMARAHRARPPPPPPGPPPQMMMAHRNTYKYKLPPPLPATAMTMPPNVVPQHQRPLQKLSMPPLQIAPAQPTVPICPTCHFRPCEKHDNGSWRMECGACRRQKYKARRDEKAALDAGHIAPPPPSVSVSASASASAMPGSQIARMRLDASIAAANGAAAPEPPPPSSLLQRFM
ncbi:hypothetical protein PPROV_000986200 [Pycnococcus provasolii]|uniref:SNF2 super family n=1 Tax=Pycnococcus provasolii TaxID=41880 RepID=A0A830HVH6_9CHLO|nr:hypothetical protein PPROV_000986200 [Pycnococcus provasolii]